MHHFKLKHEKERKLFTHLIDNKERMQTHNLYLKHQL